MTRIINHIGVVQSVEGACVHVLIKQASACGTCAAKALCTSAESKEKNIDICTPEAFRFKAGQQVVVVGKLSDGLRAAWIAYLLPLLILTVVLVIVNKVTGNEVTAALWGLASLVPYFILLRLLRERLRQRFSFQLRTCPTEYN